MTSHVAAGLACEKDSMRSAKIMQEMAVIQKKKNWRLRFFCLLRIVKVSISDYHLSLSAYPSSNYKTAPFSWGEKEG